MPESKDKTFKCEVFLADRTVLSTDATYAVFSAVDGQLGVLAHRAPVAAVLGKGPLMVRTPDQKERRFQVAGGVAHMRDNVLSVLAVACEEVTGKAAAK
jgi:F0F1-type ATP synthase epsilon subunit